MTLADLESKDARLANPKEDRGSVNGECREQQSGKKGKKPSGEGLRERDTILLKTICTMH